MKVDECIPKMGSEAYKRMLFITTALRNLHSSDNCITYFKNKKCECIVK